MKFDNVLGYSFLTACTLAIVGAFGFGAYAVYGSVRSNGEIDYCYTEMWSPGQMAPQFQLYGHRPWRSDRMMGVFSTVEEVRAKADALSCPMGKR